MRIPSFSKKLYIPVVIAFLVLLQLFSSAQTGGPTPRSDKRAAPEANKATGPDAGTSQFFRLAESVGQSAPARRLVEYKSRAGAANSPRYWGIVDFNQPSSKKRFYVFDTVDNKVETFYVSHGRGSEGASDDGIADVFSDEPASLSSSLGIYMGVDEYVGKHGRSLRLRGVEPSNSNALDRAIVLHEADYVSEDFIKRTGRLGRSEGCFAVEPSVRDALVDKLKDGAYIIAWKK